MLANQDTCRTRCWGTDQWCTWPPPVGRELCTQISESLPAPADRGATRPPCPDDPGTLRILRSGGERQTTGVVPLSGHSTLAEVACSPQPPSAYELGPDECTAQAIPLAISTDRASMARSLQRICQVRNRVRETRSLGSARGGAPPPTRTIWTWRGRDQWRCRHEPCGVDRVLTRKKVAVCPDYSSYKTYYLSDRYIHSKLREKF